MSPWSLMPVDESEQKRRCLLLLFLIPVSSLLISSVMLFMTFFHTITYTSQWKWKWCFFMILFMRLPALKTSSIFKNMSCTKQVLLASDNKGEWETRPSFRFAGFSNLANRMPERVRETRPDSLGESSIIAALGAFEVLEHFLPKVEMPLLYYRCSTSNYKNGYSPGWQAYHEVRPLIQKTCRLQWLPQGSPTRKM